MKKLLCFLAILLFCLPTAALADVLADGWQDAGLEELQAAQQELATRIGELRAESAASAPADVAHYEGNGLSMIPLESFPFFPCRMVLAVDAEGGAKVEITGGKFDWKEEFTATGDSMSSVFSYDRNNYGASNLTLLVTTDANWTLDVYPLAETGTPALNGAGNAVGDLFALTGPMAITVSYDASANSMDYLSIELVTPSDYGYLRERVFGESLSGDGLKGSADVFIKPKNDSPCFYIVKCKPETTWAITPKE